MRFLYILLFLLTATSSWSQNQFFLDTSSYNSALEASKTQGKPVFIMLYADWCPHCTQMKNNVFNDASVTDYLKSNFICLTKNVDQEEGVELKNKFGTKSLPAFLFIDKNETLLYALKGEMKKQEFMAEVGHALNPKMHLNYLEKQFMDDPSSSVKFLSYLNVLKKGKERTQLSPATHHYLNTQSDAQLISEVNWRIISNGVTDINSREFQYVLKHKKEFEAVASPIRVERKIESIVKELLRPHVDNLDATSYYRDRETAKSIGLPKTDSLIFRYDLTLAERVSNWEFYQKTTLENTGKMAWNDAAYLKEIGHVYHKYITDETSLKKAVSWIKRSLELNDSYDGNLLLAKLYHKLNDKKSAMQYAKTAKLIGTEMSWDTAEVDVLLKTLKS
jgi:thioredoxin-related protein